MGVGEGEGEGVGVGLGVGEETGASVDWGERSGLGLGPVANMPEYLSHNSQPAAAKPRIIMKMARVSANI